MSTERAPEVKKRQYSFLTFAAGLNLLILFILVESRSLIYTALSFFIISLGLHWRQNRLKQKKLNRYFRKEDQKPPSFIDNLQTAIKYFKINKKYALASALGLILAILIVSQLILIPSSYNQNSFDRYLTNNDTSLLNIQIGEADNVTFSEWSSYFDSKVNDWVNSQDLEITNHYSEGNIKFKVFMGHTYNFDAMLRHAHVAPMITSQWTKQMFKALSALPSFPGFPFKASESVAVFPPHLLGYTPGGAGSPPIIISYELDDFIIYNSSGIFIPILMNYDYLFDIVDEFTPWIFHNITYQVDRVWQLSNEDYAFLQYSDLVLPDNFGLGNLYLPQGQEWKMYEDLQFNTENYHEPPYVWGEMWLSSVVQCEIPKFRDVPLLSLRDKLDGLIQIVTPELNSFLNTQVSYIDGSENLPYQLTSKLLQIVDKYTSNLYNLDQIMMLSSIPLIILSLILPYFSISLSLKRKERMIELFKIRGSSGSQIRMMILFESLIIALVSTFVAAFLSIFSSEKLLQSSDFFTFSGDRIPLIIPYDWWWKLPSMGILLSLDFNLLNLYTLTNLDIEDSSENNKTSHSWLDYNLDLIILALCSIFWFVILLLPLTPSLIEFMFRYFGKFILILTFIGIPMVMGRYHIVAIERILIITKSHFDLLYLAVRNIRMNKQFTSQLIALLLAATMLTFMNIILTETINDVSKERSLYTLGSEISIEDVDYYNINITASIQAIPELQTTSNVRYIEYIANEFEVPIGEEYEFWTKTTILAIDPDTYAETAFWKDGYARESLSELLLKLNSTAGGVIIQNDYAKFLELGEGDNYQFPFWIYAEKSFQFTVSSIVDYFPRIFMEKPKINEMGVLNQLPLITTLDTLQILLENQLFPDTDVQIIYANPVKGSNVGKISRELYYLIADFEDVYQVKNFEDEQRSFFQDSDKEGLAGDEQQILEISIHVATIISLIVILIGVANYSFVFVYDRFQEIGIYRALGMTQGQIRKLLLYEISIMVISGITIGTITGQIMSYLTILVLANGNIDSIPPFNMYFPSIFIVAISLMLMFTAICIASIPIWRTTRGETNNILRTF